MKKFLLFASLILVACSTPEKRAKNLIVTQLKETLHDWDSYESVKFGSLDSVYTTPFDDPSYKVIVDDFFEAASKVHTTKEDYDRYERLGYLFHSEKMDALTKWGSAMKTAEDLKSKMDSIEQIFVPEFKGWSMTHSFRCNNAGGHKTIHHYQYHFNKDLSTITENEDIGEKD